MQWRLRGAPQKQLKQGATTPDTPASRAKFQGGRQRLRCWVPNLGEANLVLKEGLPQSVGMDPARLLHIRELALGWVKRGDTPSVVVLVARHGTIVLHQAFGVRHYEDTTPTLTPDSIFPIASLTKPMTAALVMCLVEDGLVGLNRPFIDYIPELDVPGVQWIAEARVADLVCHTACIEDLQWDAFIEARPQRRLICRRRARDSIPP